MLYKLGRFLQFVGLFLVVPFAIAGNVLEKLDLKDFLLLAGVGMGIFTLGWLMQQSSRPQ
jgi:hypothetical protein